LENNTEEVANINPRLKTEPESESEENGVFQNRLRLLLSNYYLLLEIKCLLRENSIVSTDLPDDLKIAEKAVRLSKNYLLNDVAQGSSNIKEHFISIFQRKIDLGFQRPSNEKATVVTDSTSDSKLRR